MAQRPYRCRNRVAPSSPECSFGELPRAVTEHRIILRGVERQHRIDRRTRIAREQVHHLRAGAVSDNGNRRRRHPERPLHLEQQTADITLSGFVARVGVKRRVVFLRESTADHQVSPTRQKLTEDDIVVHGATCALRVDHDGEHTGSAWGVAGRIGSAAEQLLDASRQNRRSM